MLTQLVTVKTRLALEPFDATYDAILTGAIEAFSARFDRDCNRTLCRTVDMVEQFNAGDLEIPVTCYPIESITSFELNTQSGWTAQTDVEYIIRRNCVISLATPLPRRTSADSVARVTYTGGYLLPGTPPVPAATPLPADLENATIEQVAFWFLNRDKLGQIRTWPAGGNYVQLADTDLLPSVRATLKRYTRFTL